jgi:hypothetical protein
MRRRRLPATHARLVGAIVLALVAAGITIGLVNRGDSSASPRLRSVAKRAPSPTTKPIPKRVVAKKPAKTLAKPRTTVPHVATTTPVTVGGGTPVAPPPVTPTVPTTPPTTPSYPPSALSWQTTPAALTIKAGGHAGVSVTVSIRDDEQRPRSAIVMPARVDGGGGARRFPVCAGWLR